MLVRGVEGSELPAFAEDVQPESRSSERGQVGRGAPERSFELPANEREDRVEDRVPDRLRQGRLARLEVPAARDEQAPPSQTNTLEQNIH